MMKRLDLCRFVILFLISFFPSILLYAGGSGGGNLVMRRHLQNAEGTYCVGEKILVTFTTDVKDPRIYNWVCDYGNGNGFTSIKNSNGSLFQDSSYILEFDRSINFEIVFNYVDHDTKTLHETELATVKFVDTKYKTYTSSGNDRYIITPNADGRMTGFTYSFYGKVKKYRYIFMTVKG